jgi:uncharacterized protein YbjT (DUF2867 family)
MKILLTGVTGYIGKRLLSRLLDEGHEVICCVRDVNRFHHPEKENPRIEILEIDFLEMPDIKTLPKAFDIAYYLIHSMTTSIGKFGDLEAASAENFREYMAQSSVKQVIYLGGIANHDHLSEHLESRKNVEEILKKGDYHHTVLRAGIIVGSGSASFEIIRDLVEKLPVMVTPKWLRTHSQPISVRNILHFLTGVIEHPDCLDQSFDIGGPDVLTYKDMLMQYAEVRGLKRRIFIVPVMTPRLSSYWLYFVTATSYKLAVNLVNSMKVEVVTEDRRLQELLKIELLSYREAVKFALEKITDQTVYSSWKDALASSRNDNDLIQFLEVPEFGCLTDKQERSVKRGHTEAVLDNIWSIGGYKGWYYASWLWVIRGFLDKVVGGVGLRRGRTHPTMIHAGDSLDFWRVIEANREEGRLLLFAEMKLPGEAWLEFKVVPKENNTLVYQTATFRPKGLLGRIYWYLTSLFHIFIFRGMINNLTRIDAR